MVGVGGRRPTRRRWASCGAFWDQTLSELRRTSLSETCVYFTAPFPCEPAAEPAPPAAEPAPVLAASRALSSPRARSSLCVLLETRAQPFAQALALNGGFSEMVLQTGDAAAAAASEFNLARVNEELMRHARESSWLVDQRPRVRPHGFSYLSRQERTRLCGAAGQPPVMLKCCRDGCAWSSPMSLWADGAAYAELQHRQAAASGTFLHAIRARMLDPSFMASSESEVEVVCPEHIVRERFCDDLARETERAAKQGERARGVADRLAETGGFCDDTGTVSPSPPLE